jgi:hypothetical protein
MPAIGEAGLASKIEYGLPDVLGQQRQVYLGRHTLLIGSGYSAATTLVALAQLADEDPSTHVTWITRSGSAAEGPIPVLAQDRLPERQSLAERANQLALGGSPNVTYRPAMLLSEVGWNAAAERFHIRLAGKHADKLEVDQIVANVGYRPDNRLWSELQIHECYASGGPMKLAAALMGQTSPDCLDQQPCGPQALVNPEPDFYVLGAKSYGRDSRFLISAGLTQIRDLFTILADRAELDLYANMAKLRS